MDHSPLRRAVSTWSLHRTLGNFVAPDSSIVGGKFMDLPELEGGLTLLELIPELHKRGYSILQICHFHLESREDSYLRDVREALETNQIELDLLLIDDGDLTATDTESQLAWYSSWLHAADLLGAKGARLCAGRSEPTPERLQQSGRLLAELAQNHPRVRIVTENWMELIPDADSLFTVLDAAGDGIGVLIDLANWDKPEKYTELPKIAHLAESCHAKCVFDESGPDEEDFRKTLGILKDAGFNGPLALIYDGPSDDEWAGLEIEFEIAKSVLG